MNATYGRVYLIPTTLGGVQPLEVLPLSVKRAVEGIDHYIAEHEKQARRFINSVVPRKSQPDLHFSLINKYTDQTEIPGFLDPCLQGLDVGVLSDAGCPGIADPGAAVVAEAHRRGLRVIPLVGPSSILMGMMASGMNGQNFAFNGYLPIDKRERKRVIKKLEKRSLEENQSQAFIETPYRNDQMLTALINTLLPQTAICIACDISLPTEYIRTQTASSWAKTKVDLNKRPTLFIIQKQSID